jgi:hypothetical protein
MSDLDGVIEGRKLVLRDSEGRVRVELSGEVYEEAEMSGPQLKFLDANGTLRLSVGCMGQEHTIDSHSEARVTFHTRDGRETINITSFGDEGRLQFRDKKDNVPLQVGFTYFNNEARPEVILASEEGWRMMLSVGEDQPHLTFYDGDNHPRLHLTVDRRGKPHVHRYFWRWMIPWWKWWHYYPREGAGG